MHVEHLLSLRHGGGYMSMTIPALMELIILTGDVRYIYIHTKVSVGVGQYEWFQ